MTAGARPAIAIATSYLRFLTGMAAVLVVTPMAVRALGAAGFGLWALAVATIGLVGLLESGITSTAVRYAAAAEGAGDEAARNRCLSTLALLGAAVGLAVALLAWSLAPAFAILFDLRAVDAPTFVLLVRVGGIAVGLSLPAGIWRASLVARGDLPLVNVLETASVLAGAFVTATGLARGDGTLAMIAGFAITTLAPGLASLPLAYARSGTLSIRPRHASFATWRQVRGFAGAATLSNTAGVSAARLEPMLVTSFMPLAAVGHFSVASRVADYLSLLARQFANALSPSVAQAHGAGRTAEIRRLLLGGTATLFAGTTMLASVVVLHADSLLTLWLGNEFAAAAPALRVLVAAAAVSSLTLTAANVLGMTGGHRTVAVSATCAAALRLCGGALLIPAIGLTGPGIAAIVASLFFDVGWVLRRTCRSLDIRLPEFLRSAAAPGLAGLTGFWIAAAATGSAAHVSTWPGLLVHACALAAISGACTLPWLVPAIRRGRLQSAGVGSVGAVS